MKLTQKLVTLLLVILFSGTALAEIAVIVHPSNGDAPSAKDIERIFLGKSRSFPGGAKALPVNQGEGSPIRQSFDQGLLGRSASQMKAYWSKQVFTGKGTPPQEAANDAEVKSVVSANPNTISYIDASAVDDTVKVVHRF